MRYSPARDMLVIGERFAGNRHWYVIAVGGLGWLIDWLVDWLRDLWNVAVAVTIAVLINRLLDWIAERSLNCSDCSSGCSSGCSSCWLTDWLKKEQYSSEREQLEWRVKSKCSGHKNNARNEHMSRVSQMTETATPPWLILNPLAHSPTVANTGYTLTQ